MRFKVVPLLQFFFVCSSVVSYVAFSLDIIRVSSLFLFATREGYASFVIGVFFGYPQ